MDLIDVWGGVALQGKARIQGSKNAVLPILAATLLVRGTSFIRNCPKISDVYAMLSLLENIGCTVRWQDDGVLINATSVCRDVMDTEAVTGMRSSLCLLGALLGRCGEVFLEYPGGCVIGKRPIDLHIRALEQMGVVFDERDGKLHAAASRLQGADICMQRSSVGVTENVILAAVGAEGITRLKGAAREPEVQALCEFLQLCGARIEGIGTDELIVWGGDCLHGIEYRVKADRIVAGTYLFATMGTGGTVFLEDAPVDEMETVLRLAERMGGQMEFTEAGLYIQGPERPASAGLIETECYPGFPTDLQSVLLAVASICGGETRIRETIFENRFRVVKELRRMGADITFTGENEVLVKGVSGLKGAVVTAEELRGGAALVTAGLLAGGHTRVLGCSYVYRGYESISRDYKELGARIISV